MDEDAISLKRVLFMQKIGEGEFKAALDILKEMVSADLDVNFVVETQEQIVAREYEIEARLTQRFYNSQKFFIDE